MYGMFLTHTVYYSASKSQLGWLISLPYATDQHCHSHWLPIAVFLQGDGSGRLGVYNTLVDYQLLMERNTTKTN